MSPDLATVARRRHMATIVLRASVLLWALYVLAGGVNLLLGYVDSFLAGNLPIGALLFEFLLPIVVRLALAGVVLLLEKRLVRWVVPLGTRESGCPRCGYAMKDLKSPVCPECGLDLRAGA